MECGGICEENGDKHAAINQKYIYFSSKLKLYVLYFFNPLFVKSLGKVTRVSLVYDCWQTTTMQSLCFPRFL